MTDMRLAFQGWAKDNIGQPHFAGYHGTNGVWFYNHNFVQAHWLCWMDAVRWERLRLEGAFTKPNA
jgi:hypothetical protein